jgi:hypothetical protein
MHSREAMVMFETRGQQSRQLELGEPLLPLVLLCPLGEGARLGEVFLLSSHASLCFLSPSHLFSLAGPFLVAVAGDGSWLEMDSCFVPPRVSNTALTQLPASRQS